MIELKEAYTSYFPCYIKFISIMDRVLIGITAKSNDYFIIKCLLCQNVYI